MKISIVAIGIFLGIIQLYSQNYVNIQLSKYDLKDYDMTSEISMEQNLSDLKHNENIKKCKCSYSKRFTFFEEDLTELDKIAKQNYIYALMSANAYDKGFQVEIPKWKRVKRYVIQEHGFSADVYISDDNKNVVIAYRGTDDLKDWIFGNADTDVHGQYADADNIFSTVYNEYAKANIMVVGHSLGGGLALHVSITHKDVDAVVFNTSPRVFVAKEVQRYKNKVVLIYETGEILTVVREIFTTLDKIDYEKYKYNYLGGNVVSEHNMADFATCMYLSTISKEIKYSEQCKDNTWFK